jgi:uncharacterized protein (DUF58 family)
MNRPALPDLVALRGAARGLSLHAHRPALARLQGAHRSAQRGRGLEFEEVRPYAPGDDARNIDWRVTARRGRPHTKLFREERERPVWLVADLHDGLYFGSRRQLKSTLLLRSAALLAWVAALGGDRLGAVIGNGGDRPHILPPRTREAGVLPVLETLVEAQPTAPGLPLKDSLNTLFAALRPLMQPARLALVMSDFSTLDESAEGALAALAAHGDIRLLWLADPLESAGLPNGRYRAGLPGRLRWLDGAGTRSDWQAQWQARRERLEALARRLDLPLNRLETTQSVREAVPALLREPEWAA